MDPVIRSLSKLLACILLLSLYAPSLVSGATTNAPAKPPSSNVWGGWGGNIYNNRWQTDNSDLNSTTIGKLVQNCKLDYPMGVSATPVVLNDTVYYPTANGSLYALHMGTCKYAWSVNVTKIVYDFEPLSVLVANNSLPMSRTSPQIDGDILYFGTQANALLVAVNVHTGELIATIRVNPHPLAIITMSPTVYNGKVFVGCSSQEESATIDLTYKCCDFIGNFGAFTLDVAGKKFTQVWNINTMPSGKGWSGAGVWGSQPSIDPVRSQVFIGTGNTYTYPREYAMCVNETSSCMPDDVWQESIIALDVATGKVNWRKSMSPLDGWLLVCGYPGAPVSASALCPDGVGPDVDFAMAPTFVPADLGAGTTGKDSIVVGQKNGNFYSFDAVTGDVTWASAISSDSKAGGWLSWGIAVDDTQVYYTAINYGSKNWTLSTENRMINNSAFGALNLKTGQLVWETQCPDNQLSYSPPARVNDLAFFAQSGSSKVKIPGAILALSSSNGNILQKWPVESVVDGGISVNGGFLLFGSGYHYRNPYNAGSFYVLGLPDSIEKAKIQATATPTPTASNKPASPNPTSAKKAAAVGGFDRYLMLTTLYPVAILAICMTWLG